MLTTGELDQRYERLTQFKMKMSAISAERRNYFDEAKRWAATRDDLNKQVKLIGAELNKYKGKRDALNEEVKKAKQAREGARDEVRKIREQAQHLIDDINKLKQKAPGGYRSAKETIDRLEWKIQTESMPTKEENQIIEQLKILESQLIVHNHVRVKVRDRKTKLLDMKAKIMAIRMRADDAHKKVVALADESEQYHNKLMELVNSIKSFKAEADDAHKKYVENIEKARQLQEDYIETGGKIQALRRELEGMQTMQTESRTKAQEAYRKKIEEAAEAKLRAGKKLSFEEFRAMMEKGGP